jgi:2-polyprenyl-3-methyl-5-hydroxy-6-metoxy-1,4-benzoquinol methylase
MPDFSRRKIEEELMDDLNSAGTVIETTLRELDIINKYLGGNKATIVPVQKYLRKNPDKETKVLDLGCGSGEILKLIAKWAAREHINVKLIGVDANPNIVRYAEKHCEEFPNIEFQTVNIFSEEFQSLEADIVLCTLFLHHFEDHNLKELLTDLNQRSSLIVINDLHRHWFAYYSIKWLTNTFSNSAMVRNDACLSVERAFSKSDLKNLLRAIAAKYSLKWKWAFRWQVLITP